MADAPGLKVEMIVAPQRGGRDDGKTFVVEEQSAMKVEKWALKMVIALKGTAGQLPDDIARLGAVGVLIAGLDAFLSAPVAFSDLEPLLDEMLQCVKIVRDDKYPNVQTPLLESDVMEVLTLGWLRSEVCRVHTGFSFADAILVWAAAAETMRSQASPST